MDAAPSSPVLSPRPDPQPDRQATGAPPRIGRLLGLIHRLIDYGTKLAATLRQPAAGPDAPTPNASSANAPTAAAAPSAVRIAFGTGNIALILASITRGLLRLAALESRLTRRAASGKDLGTPPTRAPTPRQPRAAHPAAAQPAAQAEAPDLARVLSAKEIADDIRRRPIGAVIGDICHDLGIMPGQIDRALWDELVLAMAQYGGSLARFTRTMFQRVLPVCGLPTSPSPARPAPPPACPAPWPSAAVAVAPRPP